jgi:hypothetical protein
MNRLPPDHVTKPPAKYSAANSEGVNVPTTTVDDPVTVAYTVPDSSVDAFNTPHPES